MKRLVIIGAGGFGREVLEWALESEAFGREWEPAGFIDDRADALQNSAGIGLPILGTTMAYEPRPDDIFIIGIGQPRLRAEMRQRFAERGAEFARVIHKSCTIGRRVHLEPGVILCPGTTLTCDIAIGANTALNLNCAVGHDAVIGEDCQISSFCDITGYVRLGDRVLMGSRATVIPGKSVGDDTTIGAGSVVVSNIPGSVTVFGNPAKLLTKNT
ncbi:MAG: acetyltransferase [Puniceicoccaceae bacterium]